MSTDGFLLKFYAFCGIVACAALAIVNLPVWASLLSLLVVSLPSTLLFAVFGNLKQANKLAMLEDGSWLKSLRSGAVLRVLVSFAFAIVIGGLALPQFALGSWQPWVMLLAAAPIFLLSYRALTYRVASHVKPAFKLVQPIRASSWVTFTGLFLLGFLFRFLTASEGNQEWSIPNSAPSELANYWLGLASMIDHAEMSFLSILSDRPIWRGVLAFIMGPGAVASLGASLVAFASLPRVELRRTLGKATLDTPPPPIPHSKVAWTSGFLTVFVLFVALPGVGAWETHLRNLPEGFRENIVEKADETIRVAAERIEGILVQPGTIEKLQSEAQSILATASKDNREALRREVNNAADKMIANVDPFLDDYYSLVGEYQRIAMMLTGDLADELERNLTEALALGAPTSGLERFLSSDGAKRDLAKVRRTLDQRSREIIAENRIEPTESSEVSITQTCPTAPCVDYEASFAKLRLDTSERVFKSGLAGTAGGVVAGLVAKKIVAKGTLKMAAKAMAKIVASKTATVGVAATVGSFVGGAIGSVVPGAGTAVGAVAGGALVGILVGVSVDALLIKLEEELGREAFKDEIVGVINSWRNEVLQAL